MTAPSRWLPLAAGLVPIVAVNLTYSLAATEGHVPWCFPYIESCTSISATGRHGAAFIFFKATMLPAAAFLLAYWHWAGIQLADLGDRSTISRRYVPILGTIATLFMVVYVTALGAVGDHFQLTRRIGIVGYFTGTYLCQLLVTYRFWHIGEPNILARTMVGVCTAVLVAGFVTWRGMLFRLITTMLKTRSSGPLH